MSIYRDIFKIYVLFTYFTFCFLKKRRSGLLKKQQHLSAEEEARRGPGKLCKTPVTSHFHKSPSSSKDSGQIQEERQLGVGVDYFLSIRLAKFQSNRSKASRARMPGNLYAFSINFSGGLVSNKYQKHLKNAP